MSGEDRVKVIFDTNIWISYLIGNQLSDITKLLSNRTIELVLTPQLVEELIEVTSRTKFKKYFREKDVESLLKLMEILGNTYQVEQYPEICRDAKDNFLLGLILVSKPHYLVTGDKDLLVLNPFHETEILDPAEFRLKFQ